MNAIINLLSFAIVFYISWKFIKDRWGIKQLSLLCIDLGIFFAITYLLGKHFGIVFALLPTLPGLNEAENSMKVASAMVKTALVFLPICYVFEWWYYKKNPNINPYTGKQKSQPDEVVNASAADRKSENHLHD